MFEKVGDRLAAAKWACASGCSKADPNWLVASVAAHSAPGLRLDAVESAIVTDRSELAIGVSFVALILCNCLPGMGTIAEGGDLVKPSRTPPDTNAVILTRGFRPYSNGGVEVGHEGSCVCLRWLSVRPQSQDPEAVSDCSFD